MKLTKQTVVALAAALGLGGFLYYWEMRVSTPTVVSLDQSGQLFQFKQEDLQTITIKFPQQTLKFQSTGSGEWQMLQPIEIKANTAAVGFLVNLLVSGEVNRRFEIDPEQKSEYGLAPPAAEIILELSSGQTQQLLLGSLNFDQSLVYGLVNPSSEETVGVVLLPVAFFYGVDRELWEWHREN